MGRAKNTPEKVERKKNYEIRVGYLLSNMVDLEESEETAYVAGLLGINEKTFKDKMIHGRFTAAELVYLADMLGYDLKAVKRKEVV